MAVVEVFLIVISGFRPVEIAVSIFRRMIIDIREFDGGLVVAHLVGREEVTIPILALETEIGIPLEQPGKPEHSFRIVPFRGLAIPDRRFPAGLSEFVGIHLFPARRGEFHFREFEHGAGVSPVGGES